MACRRLGVYEKGHIATKLFGFDRGVMVRGGLPIAIATPGEGSAFDIAGQCKADLDAILALF